jgi:hypothetical protein
MLGRTSLDRLVITWRKKRHISRGRLRRICWPRLGPRLRPKLERERMDDFILVDERPHTTVDVLVVERSPRTTPLVSAYEEEYRETDNHETSDAADCTAHDGTDWS